jgi:hypothetical protein
VTDPSAPAVEVPGSITQLDAVAAELARHGWAARLEAPPGRLPCLHVQNPAAPASSGHVYAQRRHDGIWTYWWSWAQAIASTPAEAAAIIVATLQAADS